MKKIAMVIATAFMAFSVAHAQDINAVTETYNNSALSLDMGNKQEALDQFQSALSEAEALGEIGVEIAEQCKAIIPQLMISIAKDNLIEENFDAAYDLLVKAKEASALYGNIEKEAEADGLINQPLMQKANGFLNAKDFANAITVYEQLMTLDPTNDKAALRLGQCYASTGNFDEAEKAFNVAAANGQEKQAYKQLSNLYFRKAQTAFKAKNLQEAIDFANKSNEYLENANAYKIAGQCSMTLGKTAEGLPLLEKYVELSPNAKDANQMRFNIAATAQKLGDKEKAKDRIRKVCAYTGINPDALTEELSQCEVLSSPDELFRIAELVADYLLWLYRHAPKHTSKQNRLVSLMKNHADEMFKTEINLSKLAETYNRSEKYMGSLFKKSVGMSFAEYKQEKRLELAESLLVSGNDRIIDIALECGFNCELTFETVFKKLTHMTPRQYRKSYSKKAQKK